MPKPAPIIVGKSVPVTGIGAADEVDFDVLVAFDVAVDVALIVGDAVAPEHRQLETVAQLGFLQKP